MNDRRVWGCLVGLNLLLAACGGGGGSTPPVALPTISAQPVGITVNSGQPASFTVTAAGATGYQWQQNGTAISGATSASYTVASASSVNNGAYTVVVSNAGGSVTSAAATLRVTGISVLAGQIGGEGYADGAASQARFWGPTGIALDAAGNLYVADDNAVRKITPAGVVSTLAGSPRTCGDQAGNGSAARLCYPSGVAVDDSGNVYAVDGSRYVWQIDPMGSMSLDATAPFGQCPSGLAAIGSVLYMSDGCDGVIGVVGGGQVGGTALVIPSTPVAISFDASQNLFIANNTVVQQLPFLEHAVSLLAGSVGNPGSANGTGAAAQFGCSQQQIGFGYALTNANGAAGIATTPAGLSYVTDYCNNEIRMVTSAGVVTTFAGSTNPPGAADGSGAAAQFWGPAGIVVDPLGNLYVADYLNALIRKITPAGDVSTYAGQTPHAGTTDGPGPQASFRYPFGITVDSGGNLYVADTYNETIRKITPAGVVSTIAGLPTVSGSADGLGSAARFADPEGIAIDSKGNLFVADTLNEVIREVSPSGVVTTVAGVAGSIGYADGLPGIARFNRPNGVAIDSADNLYVADFNGVRLVVPNGLVTTLTTTLHSVSGLTWAPNGMLYATINTNTGGYVYSVTTSGTATLITNAAGHGSLPGIVMGGDGNLYVGDRNGSQINRVSLSGTVTPVVGTSALPIGIVPGGLPGNLNAPTGLALLSSGTSVSLAVVDSFEHAVLRVDLP
jgi:sugar lactone lactonase YvrE